MTDNRETRTSVALIDDHEMFRDGLTRILNDNGYDVTGAVSHLPTSTTLV